MKRALLTSFVELEREELEQLCCVVDETVATGVVLPEEQATKKSYGINDLWNLRRRSRKAGRGRGNAGIQFIVRG